MILFEVKATPLFSDSVACEFWYSDTNAVSYANILGPRIRNRMNKYIRCGLFATFFSYDFGLAALLCSLPYNTDDPNLAAVVPGCPLGWIQTTINRV